MNVDNNIDRESFLGDKSEGSSSDAKHESVSHKIGDAIERLGHKISDAGAKGIGQAISSVGNKIEHAGDDKAEGKAEGKVEKKDAGRSPRDGNFDLGL
jgi:predicted small secreted protein